MVGMKRWIGKSQRGAMADKAVGLTNTVEVADDGRDASFFPFAELAPGQTPSRPVVLDILFC